MSGPVFRFAPSPNGYLHLGHARSALLNARAAAAAGGRFLLRIEDIDVARSRPAYIEAVIEDLRWLGLSWEEPVRRQSAHFSDYRAALDRLQAMGLLYPSFATRTARARGATARDPDGAPRVMRDPAADIAALARRAEAGEPHALRLDMAAALRRVAVPLTWQETGQETGAGPAGETGRIAADPAAWGDVVLARKDVPTSYHLAVVVDDALQSVTDIVRGADLFHATSVHRLLQALLGLGEPRYHHHALVRDAEGRKLSKSAGSTAIRALRAQGLSPQEVRRLALEE